MKFKINRLHTLDFILVLVLSKIEILNTRERLQLEVKLGIEATWRKYLQN